MSGTTDVSLTAASPLDDRMGQNSGYKETLKDVFASFVGSSACVYVGLPFDTIKVRLQLGQGTHYSGAVDCIKDMWKTEGLSKFWSGAIPALTGAVLENAVAFGINGVLKRLMGEKKEGERPSVIEGFATGAVTGFVTSFVLCPCEVLKCRSQAGKTSGIADNSLSEVFKRTVKKEGMRGLYTGITAQTIMLVPFYMTFFGAYDAICGLLKDNTDWSEPVIYGTAGGLAGQAAWAIALPLDAVKSTTQVSTLYFALYLTLCFALYILTVKAPYTYLQPKTTTGGRNPAAMDAHVQKHRSKERL